MNILIDISHPGHVHLYKHFAWEMEKKNNHVLFTTRNKDVAIDLLKYYKFDFINIGTPFKSLIGKIFGLFYFTAKLLFISIKFKPSILINASPPSAIAAFLLRKPHIALEDTGNKEQINLYRPFTKYILTPSVFPDLYGKKQIKYNGYHELAYLHPIYFTPDPEIYKLLDNTEKQKYVILRFVSWQATHDFGKKGMNLEVSYELINLFKTYNYRIYISSEKKLPADLDKYRIKIAPADLHHALFFADMVIGDSQTIIAEAGILGTPAIRFNELVGTNHGFHHKELEEKYHLIYNIHSNEKEKLFSTIYEIMENQDSKLEWEKRKFRLFSDKINVTEFLVNFVLNLKIVNEK